LFLVHKDPFEPPLEHMTRSLVAPVKELRVHTVELPHPQGEVAIRRFNQEMIMVVHEAVGMA
jgi:hypothetical protein